MTGPGWLANSVFPVPASLLPRKNALIVYAGPTGGGGLNVYGALTCGKIYSVFLQMPGKPWTLQYCAAKSNDQAKGKPTQSAVIRMEPGIVPPEAELRFDFRRLPLPAEKVHKSIVLKGLMRADGSIAELKIYQGLQPQMDESARAAFSRWKFKPAIREGKPLELEVLVGIPSDAPPKQ